MSYSRRTTERRRRVLYSTHHADSLRSTAAGRREAERLREARRPTAAYGSRVHRRLRGRWFSLVPVRRWTLGVAILGLLSLVAALCLAHHAAVAWPSVAGAPEIARPLRLDRPDSFGRWVACVISAVSAGVCLLIYQLRRYRTDDFEGHYRMWRLVLLVMLMTSVNELVGLLSWGGAILDATLGRRVALSGEDWVRIAVTIGGAALALRLIAEVRRCRWSLASMAAAWLILALPAASSWNVIEINSLGRWVLVSSAPLVGQTTLLIAFGVYLRMLYREVRHIDDSQPLSQRLGQLREWFSQLAATRQSSSEPDENHPVRPAPPPAKRRLRERFLRPRGRENAGPDLKGPADSPSETDRGDSNRKAADPRAERRHERQPDTRSEMSDAGGNGDPGAELDPSAIDWANLSKTERRRLRKQLKRQNRAA